MPLLINVDESKLWSVHCVSLIFVLRSCSGGRDPARVEKALAK
jgi:hypothetical protein